MKRGSWGAAPMKVSSPRGRYRAHPSLQQRIPGDRPRADPEVKGVTEIAVDGARHAIFGRATVRHAADLGYAVTMVRDCCCSANRQAAEASFAAMACWPTSKIAGDVVLTVPPIEPLSRLRNSRRSTDDQFGHRLDRRDGLVAAHAEIGPDDKAVERHEKDMRQAGMWVACNGLARGFQHPRHMLLAPFEQFAVVEVGPRCGRHSLHKIVGEEVRFVGDVEPDRLDDAPEPLPAGRSPTQAPLKLLKSLLQPRTEDRIEKVELGVEVDVDGRGATPAAWPISLMEVPT